MKPLSALVVDDEPLARRRLRALIGAADGVRWIGEAGTGQRALDAIRRLGPDIVFLDIEMPGLSGLQVVERAPRPIHVVFTTAYEHYAVDAFAVHAVDYLLKPFGASRLQAAVDRARDLVTRSGEGAATVRIFVRERGRILPLTSDRIVRLEADGDYVTVHADGRAHLVAGTLRELHARLPAHRFLRVHRSHVVNLDHVRSFEPHEGSRLRVRMRDGSNVVASRSRSKELRRRSS